MNKKYAEEHAKNIRKSGRKSKLSMEDKLLATLEYLREYRTYENIPANYWSMKAKLYAMFDVAR